MEIRSNIFSIVRPYVPVERKKIAVRRQRKQFPVVQYPPAVTNRWLIAYASPGRSGPCGQCGLARFLDCGMLMR